MKRPPESWERYAAHLEAENERLREKREPLGALADWSQSIELAHLWSQYWEDDPIVHLNTGKVGQLARAFLWAMADLGVISEPRAISTQEPAQAGDSKERSS